MFAFAACSSTGDALVVVTVSSPGRDLSGIVKLHANVTAAGHVQAFDVTPTSGAPFDIPDSKTFGVDIIEAYAGMFAITVDAVDKDGNILGSGAQSTTTQAGKRSDIEVMLSSPLEDFGTDAANFDLSNADFACTVLSCAQANYGCGMLATCGTMVDCGPCGLASVHPAIANVGDTVTLEGRFNPDVQANFPGVPAVAITLLGPNRATVKVPAGANSGAIALQVGGTVLSYKLPFRRVGFKVGLHEFRATLEQPESARPMPKLPQPQGNGQAALVGGTVEVFGGFLYGGPTPSPLPTFSTASLNADGTVGTYTQDPAKHLVQQRGAFAFYNPPTGPVVIGGYDGAASFFNTVERAPAHSDFSGSDGFATVAGATLNTARAFPAYAVIGSWFYVFGGTNNADLSAQGLRTIERAPIGADGSLGSFENVAVTTARGRLGATALVLQDRIYLIGGIANGTILSSIEEAAINGDGSLGSFAQSAGTALVNDRAVAGVVELGGTIYVLGGSSSSSGNLPSSSIETAPINSDGSLGNFTSSSLTMTQPRLGQPQIVGNYLWYFAGGDGRSERASIVRDGVLGAWVDSGRNIANARNRAAVTVVGDDLYLFGGQSAGSAQTTVLRSHIDGDGNLSVFGTQVGGVALPTLTTPRSSPSIAVFDRDIYVCGGANAGRLQDCEHFAAGWDGMLTKIGTTISSMGTGRQNFQMVAIEDGLFAVGGDTNGGWTNVERLALDAVTQRPAPSPTPWAAQSTAFPLTSGARAGLLVGTTDYSISSDKGPDIEKSVYAPSALGNFSVTAITMPEWRFDSALLVTGPRIYFVGGAITNVDMGGSSLLLSRRNDFATITAGVPSSFADAGIQTLGVRRGAAGVVLLNFAFLLDGFDGSNQVGTVEQAPLQ